MSSELYGISRHNVDSILTKNRFSTYLPISAAIYMSDMEMNLIYLSTENNNFTITSKSFQDLLGVTQEQLHQIEWYSQGRNSRHTASVNAPGMDMIPLFNNRELVELEVKLTVVPTHNRRKITEMIVRQNTQYSLAERICYHYNELLSTDVSLETLRNLVRQNWRLQKPFIIHGFWKTIEETSRLDLDHTFDVEVISDLAYLSILLNSTLYENGNLTRIGRVLNDILGWINEFKDHRTITYKEEDQRSKDHLKNTIWLMDHASDLGRYLNSPRLNFEDIKRIVPMNSVEKLSPERRVDASIIYTLLMDQVRQTPKGSVQKTF